MSIIDIRGLSKAEVLAALYNGASPQGRGFLKASEEHIMTVSEAREILASQQGFDYLAGRSFKIDLSSDDAFDPRLYDRDNGGDGVAENIINRLRETGAVNSPEITEHREAVTADHAFRAPNEAAMQELIGEAMTNFRQVVDELIEAIPTPREGMTARQYLNWASDEALKHYHSNDYEKTILLFAILTEADERTAWIASHPMTPLMIQMGIQGGRAELERIMKGFAV